MPIAQVYHHALNVGVIDADKLHRVDLDRMRLGAEEQTNLVPTVVGPAFFRQGFEHLGGSRDYEQAVILPFVAGSDANYVLEFTDGILRVWPRDDDEPITRSAVDAAVQNGAFAASAGWTLNSASGQTSQITGGNLELTARGRGARAYAQQQIDTANVGEVHGIRIVISRGPVTFRCGSTAGGDDYIRETQLLRGTHSLAFVPSASPFYIEFSSKLNIKKIVDSVSIEAAGIMEIATPWALASLPLLRCRQSQDVLFVACEGVRRQRIERRGQGDAEGLSWSVVDYDSDDGQFFAAPSAAVTMTPGAASGNTTLTASAPFFRSTHVGALMWLFHEGQVIDQYLAAANQHTDPFMVTGVNETDYNDRDWSVTISGTFVGTLRTQRSFDGEDVEFHDFRRATGSSTVDITAGATYANDDNDDNAITWYRFNVAAYTSGEIRVQASYDGGGGYGICRIVGFTSSTQVDIEILTDFKGTYAVTDWREGEWSDYRGHPTAVEFHEGRLVWFGPDRVAASVSDAYDSFDENFEGDAGPLIRAIAIGSRNEPRWGLSMGVLMIGCDKRLAQAMASSLGEILTPTNFGIKNAGPVGSAKIEPVLVADDRALFVQQSEKSIYELSFSAEKGRYVATQFSKLTTDLFTSGITGMALQLLPDQRIWITTDEDDCILCVFQPEHEVVAMIRVEMADTDVLESVCVLPGDGEEDRVYASIRREVNGDTVRYIERLALDSEARPATQTKCMDSFVTFGAVQTVGGLDHLIGRTVVAWADGAPVLNDDGSTMEFTVDDSGQILLPNAAASGGVAGLAYEGRYKSARLEYGAAGATSMTQKKSVSGAGMLLSDYSRKGVRIGTNFTSGDTAGGTLQSLPLMGPKGDAAPSVVTGVADDEDMVQLQSQVSYDTRLCAKTSSPHPLTIRSIAINVSA